MQQINFTGNIDRAEGEKLFFIIEKKEKKNTHTQEENSFRFFKSSS